MGIHRDTSKVLGRPLRRRRLSECPSCKSRLSYVSRARHLSACLFHVSASGAIIAAATANSWRLSQQNPYKDGLKRNMSRGNSLSDELDLSLVLGDTRAYLYSPVLG